MSEDANFQKYPEQSEYVSGNKIWLMLSNQQEIIVSPQAREVLRIYGIDEEKFLEKLKDLLNDCFSEIWFPFHRVSVSKTGDCRSDNISITIKNAFKRL